MLAFPPPECFDCKHYKHCQTCDIHGKIDLESIKNCKDFEEDPFSDEAIEKRIEELRTKIQQKNG